MIRLAICVVAILAFVPAVVEGATFQGLGDLVGGEFFSAASAISADGSVVVGNGEIIPGSHFEAFVWDASHGARSLQDVLASDFGLNLAGWTSICASDISADGVTIVGFGINPTGLTEGWIAYLPEPSSLCLCLAALLLCSARSPPTCTETHAM